MSDDSDDAPFWPADKPWPWTMYVVGPGHPPLYWPTSVTLGILDDPPMRDALADRGIDRLRHFYADHSRDLNAEGGVQRIIWPDP